jgi:tetratricopeptide (TPR) repeat protein
MGQNRYLMASAELRGHLAAQPDDAMARALLARCLSHEDKCDEALREAREAVAYAPDMGFAHAILAEILIASKKEKEAEQQAAEAVRLEPENASYFGVLSQIRLNMGNPRGALEAAEAGLKSDSESASCLSMRTLSLTRLGRTREAQDAARSAIRNDPMDARSYASRGWSLLEMGLPADALPEFQEALRIEPQMEWARNGMLTALKARYAVYRWILAWSFFMRRFGTGGQYSIIFGFWLAARVVSFVGSSYPALSPYANVLLAAYGIFCYLTWTSGPLFNTMLRFNRFGRLLLSRSQIVASTCYAACLLTGIAAIAAFIPTNMDSLLLLGIGSLIMSWFVGVAAQAKPLAFQRFMIGLGIVLALAIIAGVICMIGMK